MENNVSLYQDHVSTAPDSDVDAFGSTFATRNLDIHDPYKYGDSGLENAGSLVPTLPGTNTTGATMAEMVRCDSDNHELGPDVLESTRIDKKNGKRFTRFLGKLKKKWNITRISCCKPSMDNTLSPENKELPSNRALPQLSLSPISENSPTEHLYTLEDMVKKAEMCSPRAARQDLALLRRQLCADFSESAEAASSPPRSSFLSMPSFLKTPASSRPRSSFLTMPSFLQAPESTPIEVSIGG
jgi:hypothetical protein